MPDAHLDAFARGQDDSRNDNIVGILLRMRPSWG